MRRKKFRGLPFLILLLAALFAGKELYTAYYQNGTNSKVGTTVDGAIGNAGTVVDDFLNAAHSLLGNEPSEVALLRSQEVAQTDEGHQEYYFQLLGEEEKRAYRQMLEGIRAREDKFYVTLTDDGTVDKVYHALLKDHPEIYWVHNRKTVYKTTYSQSDYCEFAPGYTYTEAEMAEIDQSMENAYQEVLAQISESADNYEKVRIVYTYIIDSAEYVASEDDQSIAGIFWKKAAVCAGYAGATQYLLERLGVPCIYVDGSAKDSPDGHAWNIVELDGAYYYVDTTNGDQPAFLEGDAVQLAEHKTTIYDYLCPFPDEYEVNYIAADEFSLPDCTATDKNFYVMNQACFDSYDWQTVYDFCKMRIDNNAAVIRFKFSNQEAFEQAKSAWIDGGEAQNAAQYYMEVHGLSEVSYHYGVLENLRTIYYMF